jgi:AcrR family transcriptional regulator
VSHRTVYSYYQNKQDIFHAGGVEVGTTFLAEVRPSRLSNDATPQQVIRRENERYLRWHKSNSRWLAVAEEASGTDEVAHRWRLGARRREVRRVAASIKRWQATGLIDASIAADPTAGALVSMMTNFAYWLYEAGDQYDEAEAIETVTAVWLRAVGLAVS